MNRQSEKFFAVVCALLVRRLFVNKRWMKAHVPANRCWWSAWQYFVNKQHPSCQDACRGNFAEKIDTFSFPGCRSSTRLTQKIAFQWKWCWFFICQLQSNASPYLLCFSLLCMPSSSSSFSVFLCTFSLWLNLHWLIPVLRCRSAIRATFGKFQHEVAQQNDEIQLFSLFL